MQTSMPARDARRATALVAALGGVVAVGLLVWAAYAAIDDGDVISEPGATVLYAERAASYGAAELVSYSSRIVIAAYLDSSTLEVDEVSEGNGLPTGDTRTDVIRRFEVVETLKGSISPGEIQEVVSASARRSPANDRRPAYETKFEVLSPTIGEQYVLFLLSGPLYPGKPDAWVIAGEPGMAVAGKDGSLEFLITKDFENELREAGLLVSSGGKPAPFAATLDEIRGEIARQAAAPPPTPETPAPEPTPGKTVLVNP